MYQIVLTNVVAAKVYIENSEISMYLYIFISQERYASILHNHDVIDRHFDYKQEENARVYTRCANSQPMKAHLSRMQVSSKMMFSDVMCSP